MSRLNLSVAVRDYDRTRPLTDGTVQIDGVDPVFMALDPEEIFFRAFRHAEFDICELSMSSSTVKTAQSDFACHRDVASHRTDRQQRSQRGDHRHSGAGTVLRSGARRHVDVDVVGSEPVLRQLRYEVGSVAADVGQRGLG